MANKLDQQIPNRVPRKLGAQLGIVLTLLTLMVIVCVFGGIGALIYQGQYWVLPLAIFFALVGPLRILIAQQGYQMGYDDARLYQRNWGWNWRTLRRLPVHSMSYDEIASIHGRFVDRGGFKKGFFPFDYIELRSRNHDVPDIEIYPIYLRHPQDKDLLAAIHARRPELFPHDVLAYMNGVREM